MEVYSSSLSLLLGNSFKEKGRKNGATNREDPRHKRSPHRLSVVSLSAPKTLNPSPSRRVFTCMPDWVASISLLEQLCKKPNRENKHMSKQAAIPHSHAKYNIWWNNGSPLEFTTMSHKAHIKIQISFLSVPQSPSPSSLSRLSQQL